MLKVFASPSRYVQGPNATASLGAELAHLRLTGPAFILAPAPVREQLEPVWATSLGGAGIPFVVHDFAGECSDRQIAAGIEAARAAGARLIIGVGGGKTLDTGRAIANALGLHVVTCPTLASTDAPCSALSVVYTDDGTFERLQFYPRNPDLVLVDTAVIAKTPRRFLVSGMGDALATWYEARTCIEAGSPNAVGGLTTLAAAAIAELCARTLYADGLEAARSIEAGELTPALDRVIEANTLLSGLGFESGGLAIAHSVHDGLTAAEGTHSFMHGEKVSFGLIVQLVVEGRPAEELAQVIDFCRSVGLPTTLAEIGLADADDATIAMIAAATVAPQETAHNEPFPVTAELIAAGIRGADLLARSRARDAAR